MPKSETNKKQQTRSRGTPKRWSFGFRDSFEFRHSSAFGFISSCLLILFVAGSPLCAQQLPKPLTRVHAHNDYEHKHPLWDALDHGFCSVEADIYLVNGKLLVAHMRSQVKPERTLEKLYLDPLRQRVKENGGRVYAAGPEVVLLIDIKTDWKTTYPLLREVLKK